MAIFRRARGRCPTCGADRTARVSDKRPVVSVTCPCGATFALNVGSTWWVAFTDNAGRGHVKRIGPDKQLAKRVEAKTKTEALKGEVGIAAPPSATLADGLAAYREFVMARVKTEPARERIRCVRRIIERLGPNLKIEKVDEPMVEALRTAWLKEGYAAGTIATGLARLKAFLGWCINAKLARAKPKIHVQHPDNGRLRFLSRPEAERLLQEAGKVSQTLRDYLELLLYTGLRRGEAVALRWEWVDIGRRAIDLPAEACKSRHGRTVPLAAPVLAMLRRRLATNPAGCDAVFSIDGRPATDARIEYAFIKARTAAGLGPDVTFHVLRHTCASWLVMEGVDLFTVGQILGHRNPMVTKRYAHLAPGHLLAAIDRLAPAGGPEGEQATEFRDQDATKGNVIRFSAANTVR